MGGGGVEGATGVGGRQRGRGPGHAVSRRIGGARPALTGTPSCLLYPQATGRPLTRVNLQVCKGHALQPAHRRRGQLPSQEVDVQAQRRGQRRLAPRLADTHEGGQGARQRVRVLPLLAKQRGQHQAQHINGQRRLRRSMQPLVMAVLHYQLWFLRPQSKPWALGPCRWAWQQESCRWAGSGGSGGGGVRDSRYAAGAGMCCMQSTVLCDLLENAGCKHSAAKLCAAAGLQAHHFGASRCPRSQPLMFRT